mmetsp:Transcript_23054/g.58763  ORF Transcript_23054/g.58763 Transcript_23054/m.58763 type:complete len:326 (+) Transcript_23054:373-1350(+)
MVFVYPASRVQRGARRSLACECSGAGHQCRPRRCGMFLASSCQYSLACTRSRSTTASRCSRHVPETRLRPRLSSRSARLPSTAASLPRHMAPSSSMAQFHSSSFCRAQCPRSAVASAAAGLACIGRRVIDSSRRPRRAGAPAPEAACKARVSSPKAGPSPWKLSTRIPKPSPSCAVMRSAATGAVPLAARRHESLCNCASDVTVASSVTPAADETPPCAAGTSLSLGSSGWGSAALVLLPNQPPDAFLGGVTKAAQSGTAYPEVVAWSSAVRPFKGAGGGACTMPIGVAMGSPTGCAMATCCVAPSPCGYTCWPMGVTEVSGYSG